MSLWLCAEHGLYAGDVFCPHCGKVGSFAEIDHEQGSAPEFKAVVDLRTDLIVELRYAAHEMMALPRETKNEMEMLTNFSADAIAHLYLKAAEMLAAEDGDAA